jgi:NADH-quinone oxidoreductase subunit F
MAMPIGSMVAKFRDEFESHIERARADNPFVGEDEPREPEPALLQGAGNA